MRHALTIALLLLGLHAAGASTTDAPRPPNIVLVVIDDASPTDLGAYGGEIATPTIDALAARGARFDNFHASPMCAPSRAMLLTGVDSHTAGVADLPESVPQANEGRPGYLGRLADGVVTIATQLQQRGYRTYAAGKWHLGHTPGALPNAKGFTHSFVVDATGTDNWEQRPYLPIYDDAPWFEDGRPVRLPADYYSSRTLTDRMIGYIGDGTADAAPFFAYLPYLAIHMPVQAPLEYTRKYDATYLAGWEAVRQRRYEGAVRSGLIAAGTPMRAMPANLRQWNALSPEQQRALARAQAVNAGMLEAMDANLGRLVAHIRRIGALENTLFVVLADNGPEPSDPAALPVFKLWLRAVGYRTDVDTLGTRGSFADIGPEAAQAHAAPFALFKFHAAEGGVRVPLIVAGPGVRAGLQHDAFAYITDLAPTLLAYAGATPAPAPAPPLVGRSLVDLLAGTAAGVHPADEAIGMEAGGARAVFKGDYKLVRDRPPYGDDGWHLYDIRRDPGETKDLAQTHPALMQAMRAHYHDYAAKVGVLEVPPGYDTNAELGRRFAHAIVRRNWPAFAAGAAVLALLFGLALRGVMRRRMRRRGGASRS